MKNILKFWNSVSEARKFAVNEGGAYSRENSRGRRIRLKKGSIFDNCRMEFTMEGGCKSDRKDE